MSFNLACGSDPRTHDDRQVDHEQCDHDIVEDRSVGIGGAICTIPQSANALTRIDLVKALARSS